MAYGHAAYWKDIPGVAEWEGAGLEWYREILASNIPGVAEWEGAGLERYREILASNIPGVAEWEGTGLERYREILASNFSHERSCGYELLTRTLA